MIEGTLAPLPCVSKTSYERYEECKDERTCGIRILMKDVRDTTARIFDSTSLADVAKRSRVIALGRDVLEYSI